MSALYTSQLACRALGLAPAGSPRVGARTECVMCGRVVLPGDLRTPLKVGPSFTAYLSLLAGEDLCGWCSATIDQRIMRALQRCVVTEEGIFPIMKDVHRAWFLLTPPSPPFAVIVNTTGSALVANHLHWRAPVTVDADLVMLQIDDRNVQLDRALLMRAIDWCQQVADAMQARAVALKPKPKAKIKVGLRHPFMALDRGLVNPVHGALLPAAMELASVTTDPDLLRAIEGLRALGPGELWALATLVKKERAVPERPEPVSLHDLLNKVPKAELEEA